jgi:GDPmannose 4,6-dehydratase
MWSMLQQDEPGDYVVATGVSSSVEELVEIAFSRVGLDWRRHVRSDPALARGAAELHDLVGNAARARAILGWEPTVGLPELVGILVDAELARLDEAAAAQEASSA